VRRVGVAEEQVELTLREALADRAKELGEAALVCLQEGEQLGVLGQLVPAGDLLLQLGGLLAEATRTPGVVPDPGLGQLAVELVCPALLRG
jgi:hypothetical protein